MLLSVWVAINKKYRDLNIKTIPFGLSEKEPRNCFVKLARACHIIITSSSSIFDVLLDFLSNRKKHSTSATKKYRTKVIIVSMYSPSQNNE